MRNSTSNAKAGAAAPANKRRTAPGKGAFSASTDALRGRDLLCFSHDWNGDPLSKNHLMRALARDNRILWVNSIGYRAPTASKADLSRAYKKLAAALEPITEVESNIFVFNPLAIPAYGRAIVREFNRHFLRWQVKRAMRKLRFSRAINFVFNPPAALIAGALGEDKLIYYCVDEYKAFTGVAATSLAEMEERLCRRADLVIVSADELYKSKSRFNRNTRLIRHGVDFEHFRQALASSTKIPTEISALPRPVIGFHGLIADWVDLELIARTAQSFAHGSIALVGKATTEISALERLPNVHFFGRKPYAELPRYCKGFDVAINPFQINELTLNANPLKVREYLAAGLPVVSTPVPEVVQMKHCRIASGSDEFAREIKRALDDPGPSVARSELMRNESWEAKVDELRRHFAESA
jgi:glycosyltransferase involved in cell wall biosynthesis